MRHLYIIAAFLLFTGVEYIYGNQTTNTKGRLLTPEEGCGFSKVAHKRIMGGSVAKNGAWPWMTLLYYLNIRTPSCGGSLITTRHVLTAAHCISDKLYMVRLGEYDTRITSDGDHLDVLVEKAEKHEDWDFTWFINDIGMLFLEEDVGFNDRIRPVCLPINDELVNRRFIHSNGFLVGYGKVSDSERGFESPLPMEVQVPIIENKVCHASFKRISLILFHNDFQFDDRVVCDGHSEGGKGSCKGDSGGPLVLPIAGANGTFPFYQIGIISYGRKNTPGVNTNVQYFAEWIKNKIDNRTENSN